MTDCCPYRDRMFGHKDITQREGNEEERGEGHLKGKECLRLPRARGEAGNRFTLRTA